MRPPHERARAGLIMDVLCCAAEDDYELMRENTGKDVKRDIDQDVDLKERDLSKRKRLKRAELPVEDEPEYARHVTSAAPKNRFLIQTPLPLPPSSSLSQAIGFCGGRSVRQTRRSSFCGGAAQSMLRPAPLQRMSCVAGVLMRRYGSVCAVLCCAVLCCAVLCCAGG
jgi:hypothetical protein